jgi:hypothetical protein
VYRSIRPIDFPFPGDPRDPTAAVLAAGRTWDLFIAIVARNVGPQRAQHYGALLLTNVDGIASLESSGQFVWDKW